MRSALRRERRRWEMIILLLFLFSTCVLGVLLFSLDETDGQAIAWLPVSLHSTLTADYGSEPHPTALAAVAWNLLEDSIRDDRVGRDQVPGRIATLTNQLQTPVPNITPTSTPSPAATNLPPTDVPTSNHEPDNPEPKPVPTAQPVPVPAATPEPIATEVAPVPTDAHGAPDKPTKEPKPNDPPGALDKATKEPKATNEPKPTKEPKSSVESQSPYTLQPTKHPREKIPK